MNTKTYDFTLIQKKNNFNVRYSKSIEHIIYDIYTNCKYGFENKCSKSILKAYEIAEIINFKTFISHKLYDEIINIFYHYELSNANIDNCDILLTYMNNNTDSYERHILKFNVLDWWIDLTDTKDIEYCRRKDKRYNEIMLDIYVLLDKRREICENSLENKNMFQLIRDHIFYFKMGLYINSFNKMVKKCLKWFNRTNIDKRILHIYRIKLLQRIHYIEEELKQYNYVYIGILFDNILIQNDKENKYIIRFELFK